MQNKGAVGGKEEKQQKKPGESLPKNNKKGQETAHPLVIDERLLLEAANQYNQDNQILIKGGVIVLQQVTNIALSFKSNSETEFFILKKSNPNFSTKTDIWKIQNLNSLEKLQYLRLDNNVIQNIQNLSHLKNLQWLDLSFNCIKTIKGLDTLINLKDLSLFHNQITTLEGLENCCDLNVFSIGQNLITNVDIIISYFQYDQTKGLKFKNLEVLNVDGNPFTQENDYKNNIISNLPGLQYLDYQFIDGAEREKIKNSEEKYNNELTQEKYQNQIEQILADEKAKAQSIQSEKAANMDTLDKLHEELITGAPEIEQIKVIKKEAIEEEIRKFQDKVSEAVLEMKHQVLQDYVKINNNKHNFEKALRAREMISEQETIKILQKFQHEKKIVFRNYELQLAKLKDDQDPDQNELHQLNDRLGQLKDSLLDVEILLIDELEKATGDFEGKLKSYTNDLIDPSIDEGTQKIVKFIGEFNGKISEICMNQQQKYSLAQDSSQNQPANDDGEINEEEDMRDNLLENRENLTQTISGIQDILNEQGNNRLQKVSTNIYKDNSTYINNIRLYQYERNRKNVKQVTEEIQAYSQQIDKLLSKNESDDD